MLSRNIIEQLTDKKIPNILVVGDLIYDNYMYGDIKRVNPEAPVPLIDITKTDFRLGGAGNVIANLKALGCRIHLVGIVGDDNNGDMIRLKVSDLIDEKNISLLKILKYITPKKTRIVVKNQQLFRYDEEQSGIKLSKNNQDCVLLSIQQKLSHERFDLVILSDYNKGLLGSSELTQQIILLARNNNIPVLVDPKSDFSNYTGADYIKPNLLELQQFFGPVNNEDDLDDACHMISQKYGFSNIIITLGDRGAVYQTNKSGLVYVKGINIDVSDPCGAGDTFLSVLAMCITKGISIHDSVQLANLGAAISCQHIGTHSVPLSQLISKVHTGTNKIHRPQSIPKYLDRTKKIIFCNGCFDLLHPGHIALLNFAKEQGGQLVVAVNSDDYIRKTKGENRPRQSCYDRMFILSALSCVDLVTFFDEDTPEELMKTINPDIYVLGEDHLNDVKTDCAKSIVFFNRLTEFSTTNSIKTI
jgi:D-beta-D-heptose 7-phosphate kinase/D-beta-D-heptose 1-phosphate adenosyltransferase